MKALLRLVICPLTMLPWQSHARANQASLAFTKDNRSGDCKIIFKRKKSEEQSLIASEERKRIPNDRFETARRLKKIMLDALRKTVSKKVLEICSD